LKRNGKGLNLMMVQVTLIVDVQSGVNDLLDRDRSSTHIQFHISNDYSKHPIHARVVQVATEWKRVALKQFGMKVGEGICTDMRAVRKDYFLDHDHSTYTGQWDREEVITADQRKLEYLKDVVRKVWRILKGAETQVQRFFPQLNADRYPNRER
jgi:aspartate--ammonia ligase